MVPQDFFSLFQGMINYRIHPSRQHNATVRIGRIFEVARKGNNE